MAEEKIKVTIKNEAPDSGHKNVEELKDESKYLDRNGEKGIIGGNGASVGIRKNGQINLAASKLAQFKVNPSGRISTFALETVSLSNRKHIMTDELIVNKRKINPNIWEYTDFKKVELPSNPHAIVGNFTVKGSVLVKAWEHNLGRYMMIRRPCRMPLFGNTINVPEINKGIKVDDPLLLEENILANSKLGYQVNGKIHDKANDGPRQARMPSGFEGTDGLSGFRGNGGSFGGGSFSADVAGANIEVAKYMVDFLRNKMNINGTSTGYTDMAIAGILGNAQRETQLKPDIDVAEHWSNEAQAPVGGTGIFQWTNTRAEMLKNKSKEKNVDFKDIGVQMSFFKYEVENIDAYDGVRPVNLNSCTSVEDATLKFARVYEGCALSVENDGVKYAKEWYKKLQAGDFGKAGGDKK